MTKVVAHGWKGLYTLIDNCYYECWGADHFPSVQTRYGGLIGVPGDYKVLFKCGTGAIEFVNDEGEKVPCTGYVDGLTRKQVEFLREAYEDEPAVLVVGRKWPGYETAVQMVKDSEEIDFYKPP